MSVVSLIGFPCDSCCALTLPTCVAHLLYCCLLRSIADLAFCFAALG